MSASLIDPHKAIDRARIKLLLKQPFFGTLVAMLQPTPVSLTAGPLATDGKRLFYNPEWIKEFTEPQLIGAICHEVLHVALGHTNGHKLNRSGDREPFRWNVATDLIVNDIVESNGLELPDGVLSWKNQPNRRFIELSPPLDAPVSSFTAEQIYPRVPEQPETSGKCGLLDPATGDGESSGQGSGQSESSPGPCKLTEIDKQLWAARLKAAYENAKAAGHTPAGIEELIEELRKPRKDWRVLLAQFVQRIYEDYSWLPPDKRMQALADQIGEDVLMPSLSEGEQICDIVLAVDTSGSISHDMLTDFLSEVYAIAQIGVNLWLCYCDAAVQYWGELQQTPPPMPVGRGGTRFQPVFDEIEKRGLRCEALVYFTDMYNSDRPSKPRYPVLWISTSPDKKAPFGRIVQYEPRNKEP